MAAMMEKKWVESRESKAENKGRPVKIYKMAVPVSEIMDTIEKEKADRSQQPAEDDPETQGLHQ